MVLHKGTNQIETDRLVLRRFVEEDSDDMYNNWASSDEVTKFLSWYPHSSVDFTKEILNNWIRSYDNINTYNWCIVSKMKEQAIGNIAVFEFNETHQRCEIGFCIGEDFWKKGYMTEALKAVINFLFIEVGATRIQAKHDTKNYASGKVMIKAGMNLEGTLNKWRIHKDGTFGDSNLYAIVK